MARPVLTRFALAALVVVVITFVLIPDVALAAPGDLPGVSINVDDKAADPGTSLSILGLLTLITLAPSVLIAMTGFARILIVLGFVRNALGTPGLPPNQVLVGFALFLTLFVMAPTLEKVNDTALQPYLDQKIEAGEALERAQVPIKNFMLKQTRSSDLALFVELSRQEAPKTRADVPLTTLVPAFMISELKTAFQIGFLIYIPFLIVDMVIASTLMSMGMMMLPPVLISLPFKVLLFVLVDGWALLTQSIVAGFNT
jgi:flagellar biosynthetic protein FliP